MNARTTAKVLRRRSLAVVDQLSYVPIARLTFNIMLNVLVSQQWLFAGVRPAADYLIARTTYSVYHPVGTCRMGTDGQAVVDAELFAAGLRMSAPIAVSACSADACSGTTLSRPKPTSRRHSLSSGGIAPTRRRRPASAAKLGAVASPASGSAAISAGSGSSAARRGGCALRLSGSMPTGSAAKRSSCCPPLLDDRAIRRAARAGAAGDSRRRARSGCESAGSGPVRACGATHG